MSSLTFKFSTKKTKKTLKRRILKLLHRQGQKVKKMKTRLVAKKKFKQYQNLTSVNLSKSKLGRALKLLFQYFSYLLNLEYTKPI